MVIPCHAELVPEGDYPGLDPETRISLNRLLSLVGKTVTFGKEPSTEDYFHAETGYINHGLFIHPTDKRYANAQHIVTLGVQTPNKGVRTKDYGVIFPSTEFQIVARNSRDLGRHTVNATHKANLGLADRDQARQKDMRSAGHVLISKMDAQKRLEGRLVSDLTDLRIVHGDLIKPPLSTRYYARNLEKKRALADEKIHETVEVATIHHDINSSAVTGLHRAVRKKLYSGNYSQAERTFNWMRYLTVTGIYTAAKLEKLGMSQAMCKQELKKYQPYLESRALELAQAKLG